MDGVRRAWRLAVCAKNMAYVQAKWLTSVVALDQKRCPHAKHDGSAFTCAGLHMATIAAVGDDISHLRFNRAIARIYELVNVISGAASQNWTDPVAQHGTA
jgi:leucyl-tRNA synthetase